MKNVFDIIMKQHPFFIILELFMMILVLSKLGLLWGSIFLIITWMVVTTFIVLICGGNSK